MIILFWSGYMTIKISSLNELQNLLFSSNKTEYFGAFRKIGGYVNETGRISKNTV